MYTVSYTHLDVYKRQIYDTLNGGKEAVMLDLKKPEEMAKFHKLLEKADVFLSNNRPQALKKMGLDYDSLKERYPRLVYAVLLGYGEKGPKTNFPGFDAIAMFATGGFIQDMMVDSEGAYPIYPVSYTHLDVYKRQLKWCSELEMAILAKKDYQTIISLGTRIFGDNPIIMVNSSYNLIAGSLPSSRCV